MRIRTIKPEFFSSETVAQLPFTDRLLFIGLWSWCDDEGRGRANAALIKAALFPLDHEITAMMVAEGLERLRSLGLIRLYAIDGKTLLEVAGFGEHQRISHPLTSRLPAYSPESEAVPELFRRPQENNGSAQEKPSTEQGREQGTGSLEQGREGKAIALRADPDPADEEFAEFWKLYPPRNGKKLDRAKAATQWAKLSAAQRERAFVGVGHYAASSELPKDAHRWLRDGAFDEWQTPALPRSNGDSPVHRTMGVLARFAAEGSHDPS